LWPAVPDGTQLQVAQQIPQYLRQSSCRLALEHLTPHLPSQNAAQNPKEEEEARSCE
jgi:hypothetical protein